MSLHLHYYHIILSYFYELLSKFEIYIIQLKDFIQLKAVINLHHYSNLIIFFSKLLSFLHNLLEFRPNAWNHFFFRKNIFHSQSY